MAALLLGLLAAPSQAASGLIAAFAGEWTGVQQDGGVPWRMAWAPTQDGFSVSWSTADGGTTTAFFRPGPSADIYAGVDEPDGWMPFVKPKLPDPLGDGPLFWARTTADAVFVYRLAIDDSGSFMIDRYDCSLEEQRLEVTLQRQLTDGSVQTSTALLTRKAP